MVLVKSQLLLLLPGESWDILQIRQQSLDFFRFHKIHSNGFASEDGSCAVPPFYAAFLEQAASTGTFVMAILKMGSC